jgi:hypothetical protein
MHKYATATALAITLITMLTLAVSASVTPANAANTGWCGAGPCHDKCMRRCGDSIRARRLRCEPGAFCDIFVVPPDIRACIATCRQAKEATRH